MIACLPVLGLGPFAPRSTLLSCSGGFYKGTNSGAQLVPSSCVTGFSQWETLMEGGRARGGSQGVLPFSAPGAGPRAVAVSPLWSQHQPASSSCGAASSR